MVREKVILHTFLYKKRGLFYTIYGFVWDVIDRGDVITCFLFYFILFFNHERVVWLEICVWALIIRFTKMRFSA